MPKTKKRTQKRVIRKKQTRKMKYKGTRNRTKRGGGLFDKFKKSIGIGNKETGGSDLVLDETSVRNMIEKKINLNTKLDYITEHFSYIIKKYWNKFLNKQMDDMVIGKLITGVSGMGYYDEEKVYKFIASFGRKTDIEKQDIKACIKLYLFLDNVYELNDLSASFITHPQESGTLKTDIWDVLKGLVKEVSSEINFDETYKQDREKQLNRLLDDYRKNVSIYNSDRPEVPDPSVSTSLSPSPLPGDATPSPRRNNRIPTPSPTPEARLKFSLPRVASPSPRNNRTPSPRRNNRIPTPSPTPEARLKFSLPRVATPSPRNNRTPSPLSRTVSPSPARNRILTPTPQARSKFSFSMPEVPSSRNNTKRNSSTLTPSPLVPKFTPPTPNPVLEIPVSKL